MKTISGEFVDHCSNNTVDIMTTIESVGVAIKRMTLSQKEKDGNVKIKTKHFYKIVSRASNLLSYNIKQITNCIRDFWSQTIDDKTSPPVSGLFLF